MRASAVLKSKGASAAPPEYSLVVQIGGAGMTDCSALRHSIWRYLRHLGSRRLIDQSYLSEAGTEMAANVSTV